MQYIADLPLPAAPPARRAPVAGLDYGSWQANAIRAAQDRELAAVQFNRRALLAFAQREQDKRDATAEREWTRYRLVRFEGERYVGAILNPRGERYEREVTVEGVQRFKGCPDQAFVDRVNANLCARGEAFRMETKHALIIHLRERAAFQGLLQWTVVAIEGKRCKVTR